MEQLIINDELLGYLEQEFETSALNRLPEKFGGGKIFSHPLIGVARGSDPIFQKFKETVGSEHLTPLEMWMTSGQEELPAAELYTISIVCPFVEKIRKESINPIELPKVTLPAEIYSVARNYAKDFKNHMMRQIVDFFKNKGYHAISGKFSDAYTIIAKKEFYSTWSERHIAFAAGLGTFSLQEGLITDVGCNMRLASVITNAPLKVTPRKSDEPYANCLYYAKGTCKECARKCPANAITENGHDKTKCNKYKTKIARKIVKRLSPTLKSYSHRINWKFKAYNYPVGCEICQFGVQCTDKNPMISHHLDLD
ncbi:MAG: hypothetical protein ACFFDN_44490 [Candidatus Hodarchaeota archaeon]